MKSLEKVEKIVYEILTTDVNSRYSDHILYTKVINKLRPSLSTCNFKDIFCNYEAYRLPSFKAVERSRRKLTQKGLYIPPKNIKKEREEMVEKYIEYAVNTGGDISVYRK